MRDCLYPSLYQVNTRIWLSAMAQGKTLPDLCDDDIAGSGFAITGYLVQPAFAGDAALARLRERGLRLMLDFVHDHAGARSPVGRGGLRLIARQLRAEPQPVLHVSTRFLEGVGAAVLERRL